ncbi:TPA: ead/Ea22-like family protein [Enterobacter roggenkampii]
MSNMDKRALREAAERAESDSWGYDRDEFNEALTPYTVLALLDELEASEKLNAELMEKQRLIDICQGQGLEHRIAAEKRAEAAEKRIAELEALEVKLPNPHAHLIWIQAGHAPDDYWDDVAVSHSEKDKCCDGSDRYPVYALWEIKEALSAIGINIAAAGKGEDS